jgi:hypothetical protein
MDSLFSSAVVSSNTTVLPFRHPFSGSELPPSPQETLQAVIEFVQNLSMESNTLQTQQVVSAVASMILRNGQLSDIVRSDKGTSWSLQERLLLATVLAQTINSSLSTTDIKREVIGALLLTTATQLIGDAKVAIAQVSASNALASLSSSISNSSGTSVVSSSDLSSQTSNLLESLAHNILSNAASDDLQEVQVSTGTVKLSLALIQFRIPLFHTICHRLLFQIRS